MFEQEPAIATGRRRKDLRAAVLGICLLAAVAGAVYVSRAGQPPPVAVAPAAGEAAASAVIIPTAQLTPVTVVQGGAFSVSLTDQKIAAASATFNGREYPLVDSGGVWLAILGAGQRVGAQTVLPPGSYPVIVHAQPAGSRKVSSQMLDLTVTPQQFPSDTLALTGAQLGLITPEVEQSEAAQLSEVYGGFTPRQLWQGPFTLPVQGTVTTVFGDRVAYNDGPPVDSHPGIDIAVPMGTPVHASAAGVVAWTGQLADRGNGVIIDHGLGVFTGYYHLSEIDVRQGRPVAAGDTIGLAGSTGLSTGPHVHWEVAIGGVNVDGLQFVQQPLP